MAVTSVEFDKEVSEFEKAGLTPIPSDLVRPFRVKESPVHMECQVKDIITLGEHGGAGHLIICEMVRMHVSEDVIDPNDRINPHKIDLMGRMGRAYYVRASGEAIHTIVQPVTKLTIGYDQLPENIRKSPSLTGNNIGQLAGLEKIPGLDEIMDIKENDARVKQILKEGGDQVMEKLHAYAHEILEKDDRERTYAARIAWLAEFL
jgi:hypothetical protein